jgi:hypothetical protein
MTSVVVACGPRSLLDTDMISTALRLHGERAYLDTVGTQAWLRRYAGCTVGWVTSPRID